MESKQRDHVQNSTETAVTGVNDLHGDTVMVDSSNCDMKINNKVGENTKMVNPVYRQDVVMRNDGVLGVVTEVAGDSDSESEITDDDEDESEDNDDNDEEEEQEEDEGEGNDRDEEEENIDKGVDLNRNNDANESGDESKNDGNHREGSLIADQARVLWLDDSETVQHLNDINVVDRGFLHGDYVTSAYNPTGQIGLVVSVEISVHLLSSDGTTVKDVSSRDLKRIRDITVGDHVVLGPWLGRVDDVYDNVTVQLDDGSVYKVMGAEPMRLRPIAKNLLEDGHCPYHPGQRVRASSSCVFKNAKLLSAASRSGAPKAHRLEGTVTKVTAGSVYIHWIASAGYGPESSKSPAEEQNPKDLKLLSCFNHANWQLGDWCHLPSLAQSSSIPLEKGFSKLILKNESGCAHSECDSEGFMLEVSNEDSESMDVDVVDTESGAIETDQNNFYSKSRSCGSLPSVSKEVSREGWTIHRKKLRKIGLKRDKKQRKKEETFERALMIVNTRTKVDVAWQDGTVQQGLNSVSLLPLESPGDHDFVAEQYVVEKSADDNDDTNELRRVGVVRSVNAKEKTACVRWLKPVARPEDPREFDKEEIVSVYELQAHPDYDYCYGDLVVRLSQVFVPPEASPSQSVEDEKLPSDSNGVIKDMEKDCSQTEKDVTYVGEASTDFSDLSWVGNISGLRNGDIEVTWANEMVSMVGPQAIYVVGRDDDDASIVGGSEISDAASWETVEGDETDVIEQAEQELESCADTHVNHEIKESTLFEENNPGHNGALAIPLAAFGFVTRLASGIFSRGQKDKGSYDSDSAEEKCGMHFQSAVNVYDERPSSNSSHGSSVIDNITGQKNVDHCKETGGAESANLLDAAEALCSLKDVEPYAKPLVPLCHEDDTSGFKRFDTTKDPLDHFFLGANVPGNSGRKWLKKVQQDWNVLQNNLPDGIYVRVYEDRMDLLRAVIVGAYGTPYQDGLFFFDFHLPPEYPDVPPSAHYHSGGWRINPNLYEEGKVCLSLLNTWTGRGNEVWDPKSSSILQVLVSLQGLVLNSRPYFNEAGYDKQVGTVEGEKNSLSYNENTFLLNCKMIMYLMRRPPKDFETLVKEHFKQRAHYILKTCDAYMKGYLIGSLAKDASLTDKSEPNANSVGFKLMLAKIVPKLVSALTVVGADCHEFEHLQQS